MRTTENDSNEQNLKTPRTPMAAAESPRSVVKAVADVPSLSKEEQVIEEANGPVPASNCLKDNRSVPSRSGSRRSLMTLSQSPNGSRRSLMTQSPAGGSNRRLMALSKSPQGSRRNLNDGDDNQLHQNPGVVRQGSRRSLFTKSPSQGSRRRLMAFSRSPQGSKRSLNDDDDQQSVIVRQGSRRNLMVRTSSLKKLVNRAIPMEGIDRRDAFLKSKSKSARVLNQMEVPLSQRAGLLTKSKSESHLSIVKDNNKGAIASEPSNLDKLRISANSLVKSAGGLLHSSVDLATNTAKESANFVQSKVNSSVELVQSGVDSGARHLEERVLSLKGLGRGSKGSNLVDNSPINEMTIYSSDVYSVDYVLRELDKVKNEPAVDSLVIEDMLVRGDSDLNQAAVNLVNKTSIMPNDRADLEDKTALEMASLDLTVHVMAGEELAACDTNLFGRETSSDPYVIVSLVSDDQQEFPVGRTRHCSKTLNPTWNVNISKVIPQESFPTLGKSCKLKLKIMDHDIIGGDDCMGIVEIPIEMSQSQRMPIPPSWHVVPPKSAPKANGRIRVAVETKYCYRDVLPRTKFERHWKKFTFYDNIPSADEYERYKNSKKQIQAKLRKVLKLKGIKKMPIRFYATVEAKMLHLTEMLELLNMIENDQSVLSLQFPDCPHTSSQFLDGGYSFHRDLKKLPGTLSKKFDPTTLEWKENADPVLIRIKYSSNAQFKKEDRMKKNPRAAVVRACSLRLLKLEHSVSGMDDSWGSDVTDHWGSDDEGDGWDVDD